MLENWQSVFPQLFPQGEGVAILRKVDSGSLIAMIDRDYAGRYTDHRYVREHQS